ncbi:MAG: 50S ribosomal protein L1 [Candidatus Moranbacteria bacterium]|nr:50S ribosomal protein L1 [Candidatus Moranbacteria bacterium]
MTRGKKYQKAFGNIDSSATHSIAEAVAFVKENAFAGFDESFEAHIVLGIDRKKTDQHVRGAVVLPHGVGKAIRIAVLTSTKQGEAKEAGANLVGAEDLIESITSGSIDFDVLVATPEMMPKLAPVAKILGPRGLMPSPKTGTVTPKVSEVVAELKKGRVSFKNDNGGVVHAALGRVSFSKEALSENLTVFLDTVRRMKSSSVKGSFIRQVSVCSTMGPSVIVNV